MQHLPLPSYPSWPRPPVRLYTKQDYDGGDIFAFLSRNNLGEDIFAIGLLSPGALGQEGALAILQTWTFFGVLSDILGENVSPMAMYIPPAGEAAVPYIDTTTLPDRVSRWIAHTVSKHLSLEQRKEEQSRIIRVFRHMSDVYTGIWFNLRRAQAREPTGAYLDRLDPSVCLSTWLLYDYLDRAARIAYSPWETDGAVGLPDSLTLEMPDSAVLLERQMRTLGWCDAEANLADLKLGVLENWFVSFLNVPHPEKDHSACTEWRCSAYQVDEATYRTRHTRDNCDCELVHASQDELAAILLEPSHGAIPLVTANQPQRGEGDRLYVRLVSSGDIESSSITRFVAISHVWSDGLGNNRANAIPICQFDRLRALASRLYAEGPVAFWLDTLCFPLAPQTAYDQALVRMKDSYQLADKVLVLDEYLLSLTAADVSLDEVLARIVVAPWNRRLWTLQEAQLARRDRLFFQLADRPVGDAELLGHIHRELPVENRMETWVYISFYSVFIEMRGCHDGDDDGIRSSPMERALLAKDALTFRSTSQPSDEALCLGNIVGVPARPLVEARTHANRMRVFWEAISEDPTNYHVSVIFFAGPKLAERGWRWAPATLMDGSVTKGQMASRQLNGLVLGRSQLGLHVRLPALTFRKLRLTKLSNIFYLRIDDSSQPGEATVRRLALQLGDRNKPEDHTQKTLFSRLRGFVVLLPFAPAQVNELFVAVGQFDVMLAVASFRRNNRIQLVMPARVMALDTIASDLPRLHEVDQESGRLFVVDEEPGLEELAKRPWIPTSLVRDGHWYVD